MSLAHLNVNGNLLSLRPAHSGVADEVRIRSLEPVQKELTGENAVEDSLPILGSMPVHRVRAAGPLVPLVYQRGLVCRSQVRYGAYTLPIQFRGRSSVVTFDTETNVHGWRRIDSPVVDSVMSGIGTRTIWNPVSTQCYAPQLGAAGHGELQAFVNKGLHVDVLTARLAAFALEHALCPFTTRLRTPEPNACYFWKHQPQREQNNWALKQSDDLEPYLLSSDTATIREPHAQVVYVASAAYTYGMALLVALGRAGSPVYGQTAELQEQFPIDGNVLLVGDAQLTDRLPQVNAADFQLAISQAVHILVRYNKVPVERLRTYTAGLMSNLVLTDTTLLRECPETQVLDLTTAGAPLVAPAAFVGDAALDALSADFDAPLVAQLADPHRRAMFSSAYKRDITAVPINNGNFGAPQAFTADPQVANLLLVGSAVPVGRPGIAGAYPVGFSNFNPVDIEARAPAGGFGAVNILQYANHWLGLSGRSLYQVYVLMAPLAAGAAAVAGLGAIEADADRLLLLDAVNARAAPAAWHMVDFPYVIGAGAIIAVLYLNPVNDETTPASWDILDDQPNRFDVQQGPINIMLGGQQQMDYVRRHMRAINKLARAHDDNTRYRVLLDARNDVQGNALINVTARWGNWLHMLAQCWWMGVRGDRRTVYTAQWRVDNHLNAFLDHAIPDEFLIHLGGQRINMEIQSLGGLWAMFFLPSVDEFSELSSSCILDELCNKDRLAQNLVYMRSATEVVSIMFKVSAHRIAGDMESPVAGLAANVTAWINMRQKRLSLLSPDVIGSNINAYRALALGDRLSACLMDGSVRYTPSLHLRSPRVGLIGDPTLWHRRFIVPTVLPSAAHGVILGVALPTYLPSEEIRMWFNRVEWNDGVRSMDDVDVPFKCYHNDTRIDALLFCAVGHHNAHGAIRAYREVSAPNNVVEEIPIEILNNSPAAFPLVELRTALPFNYVCSKYAAMAALPAVGGNRLLAVPAWNNVALDQWDSNTAALGALGNPMPAYSQYLLSGNFHVTNRQIAASVCYTLPPTAMVGLSTALLHFMEAFSPSAPDAPTELINDVGKRAGNRVLSSRGGDVRSGGADGTGQPLAPKELSRLIGAKDSGVVAGTATATAGVNLGAPAASGASAAARRLLLEGALSHLEPSVRAATVAAIEATFIN